MRKYILISTLFFFYLLLTPAIILAEEGESTSPPPQTVSDTITINTVSFGERIHGDDVWGGGQKPYALSEISGAGTDFEGIVRSSGSASGKLEQPANNTKSSWSNTTSEGLASVTKGNAITVLKVDLNPVQNNSARNILPNDINTFADARGGSGAELNVTDTSPGEPKDISASAKTYGFSVASVFGNDTFKNANTELKNLSDGAMNGPGYEKYYGKSQTTLQTYLKTPENAETFGFGTGTLEWENSKPTVGYMNFDATSQTQSIPDGFSLQSEVSGIMNVKPVSPNP